MLRQVREAALSRREAPDFLPLTHHELVKLRQAPAFVRWLYVELLQRADMRTGHGRTSWPQLLALLDFDRAPTGRQRAGGVTLRQARDAFDELQTLGLVARDKSRNEAQGFLFFHVQPRAGFGTSARESGRGSGRGSTGRKASNVAASAPSPAPVPAGVRAGGSRSNSYPLPPVDNGLSTTAGRDRALAVLDALRGGGKIKAPQGGQ